MEIRTSVFKRGARRKTVTRKDGSSKDTSSPADGSIEQNTSSKPVGRVLLNTAHSILRAMPTMHSKRSCVSWRCHKVEAATWQR